MADATGSVGGEAVESGFGRWKRWKCTDSGQVAKYLVRFIWGKKRHESTTYVSKAFANPTAPKYIESTTRVERSLEGAPAESRSEDKERDMFSKSDKWLPAMPQPDFSAWKSRQEEILQFSQYIGSLKAWSALGSDTFSYEIRQSIQWGSEIFMSSLKPAQQVRASRLMIAGFYCRARLRRMHVHT